MSRRARYQSSLARRTLGASLTPGDVQSVVSSLMDAMKRMDSLAASADPSEKRVIQDAQVDLTQVIRRLHSL